jgi:hypothetical protein
MLQMDEITRRLAADKPTSTWELRPLKAAAREQFDLLSNHWIDTESMDNQGGALFLLLFKDPSSLNS